MLRNCGTGLVVDDDEEVVVVVEEEAEAMIPRVVEHPDVCAHTRYQRFSLLSYDFLAMMMLLMLTTMVPSFLRDKI